MPAALITGCSSGIGAALARALHQRGHTVFAGARRIDSLAPLTALGIMPVQLDVNDDDAIAAAMARVREASGGRLDYLVNNAGISQVGAVLDLRREDLRWQYETNVIAPVAVTRAALPLLRAAATAQGKAVVANVGSVVGILTTPFAGAYCSSKAALHALSDAMRMELAPFGIRVVTVQPGGVRSEFGNHAEAALKLPEGSLWQACSAGVHARAQAGQKDAMGADAFAELLADALTASEPPVRFRAGANSTRAPLLRALLPTHLLDAKLSKMFGLNALNSRD